MTRSHTQAPRVALIISLFSLLGSTPARAWDDKGHSMVNRLACETMPADTPEFFRKACERLAYLGPEPDRWRKGVEGSTNVDILNADAQPEHYIDMEYVKDIPLPRTGRYDYIRALLEHGIVKDRVRMETPGFLPYRIVELTEMIRREWWFWRHAPEGTAVEKEQKRQIEENIIHMSGVLGHYVGDGGQPLHTTWHYNGWVEAHDPNPNGYTTDRGIHQRFEGDYVLVAIMDDDVRPKVPALKTVTDDWDETIAYLTHAYSLFQEIYRLDKEGQFTVDPNNPVIQPEGKAFTVERLGACVGELRDLWYSAYHRSDVPAPTTPGPG